MESKCVGKHYQVLITQWVMLIIRLNAHLWLCLCLTERIVRSRNRGTGGGGTQVLNLLNRGVVLLLLPRGNRYRLPVRGNVKCKQVAIWNFLWCIWSRITCSLLQMYRFSICTFCISLQIESISARTWLYAWILLVFRVDIYHYQN